MKPELNWDLGDDWQPESWSDLAEMILVRDGVNRARRRLCCAADTLRSWISEKRMPDMHHKALLVRVSGIKPEVALAMMKSERKARRKRDAMKVEEFQKCVDMLIRHYKALTNILQYPGWEKRNTEKVSKLMQETQTLLAEVDEFS